MTGCSVPAEHLLHAAASCRVCACVWQLASYKPDCMYMYWPPADCLLTHLTGLPHCSEYWAEKALQHLAKLRPGTMSIKQHREMFQAKAAPCTAASRLTGPCFGPSVWVSLLSLISSERQAAVGRRVCLFSFGSGTSATMMVGGCRLRHSSHACK